MDLKNISQVSVSDNNSEDQFSLESVSPPPRRRQHQPPAPANVNPPPQGNDLENLTRAYLVSAQDKDEKKRLLQDHLMVAKEKVRQTEEVVNATLEGRVTTNEAGDVLINMEGLFNIGEGVLGLDDKQVSKARTWGSVGMSAFSALWQLKPFFVTYPKGTSDEEVPYLLCKYAGRLIKNSLPVSPRK